MINFKTCVDGGFFGCLCEKVRRNYSLFKRKRVYSSVDCICFRASYK